MRASAAVAALLLAAVPPIDAAAQGFAVRTEALFYGDNTEFRNPFREGETIFGAAVRVAGVIDLSDSTAVSIGASANQRFGSEKSFEQVRPVISLTVRGDRSTFVMGTLPWTAVTAPAGPDRGGPHGLLPALQRETLTYDRPYEAGLAWQFDGTTLRQNLWVNWQRLNTPEHRERFDGGVSAALRVSDHVTFPVQLHVVHEGGQLFASGAVADSAAVAAGVQLSRAVAGASVISLDVFGLLSRYVPDRSRRDSSRDGTGFFSRAAVERSGWRGHVLFWRGRNYIKNEGDPNYQSMTRGGERYRGTRDYSEAGLTRRFRLATDAILEVSGRVHRVERHYEYSYRVMSVVSSLWRIR